MDRTKFTGETECLVRIDTRLGHADDVFVRLQDVDGIEHVFLTADSTVLAKAVRSPSETHSLLTDVLTDDEVEEYRVSSVLESLWNPQLGTDNLEIECAICGKSISGEGETVEVDSEETYHVCCSSCAEKIVEQYESLKQAADE
ncbi:TRASH domain-containing protein [Saliphagus sp. LR7]|uniref:TRASH domain-containing protein n=1 Tax=Saliphagus sp. LR7 TaxID=2282654 RepID=UPI000DF78E47|nr:TRASH domain-containing protein [Saliphagus sp. LR7]